MSSIQWTNDPLHNIMQLTPELADAILKELADYEMGLLLDVPSGEFTYKPQLLALNTPFSKRYTPLFLKAISHIVDFEVFCERCDDFMDVPPDRHDLMLWIFENCVFYGPTFNQWVEDWDWKVRIPGNCTAQPVQGNELPAQCTCRYRGAMSYDPGPRFNPRPGQRLHPGTFISRARYAWRTTSSSEIITRGLDKPGMRHCFMHFEGGAYRDDDEPPLLDRSIVKICPCCDDERGPRQQPVFVNRSRGVAELADSVM